MDNYEWKRRLRPFGDHIYQMAAMVSEMDDEELIHLGKSCGMVSSTNIGWGEFQAAELVKEFVRHEQVRRANWLNRAADQVSEQL